MYALIGCSVYHILVWGFFSSYSVIIIQFISFCAIPKQFFIIYTRMVVRLTDNAFVLIIENTRTLCLVASEPSQCVTSQLLQLGFLHFMGQ